jgi:hypothetical protein
VKSFFQQISTDYADKIYFDKKKKESNENLLRMVFVSIFCVTPLSSTLHPAISKTET